MEDSFKDKYEKLSKLGGGTYGNVFKALDRNGGKVVALKKFSKFYIPDVKEGVSSAIISEIFLLKKCNHPSIIKIIEYDKDLKMISFPIYDQTLEQWVENRKSEDFEKKIDISHQILEGLNYLHSNRIVHRDIKPNNILIKTNDNGKIRAVICDFSVAFVIFDKNKKHATEACCYLYRPPECLGGYEKYGHEIDMWAFGVVFAEMFSNEHEHLFQNEVARDQLREIFMCLGSPSQDVIEKYYTSFMDIKFYKPCLKILENKIPYGDNKVLDLVLNLLNVNPEDRWSANMALQHSLFSDVSQGKYVASTEIPKEVIKNPMDLQDDINSRMLKILVSWLAEVCQEYNLTIIVFFRAIKIMMEYLNLKNVKRGEFQLLGVTSLLIASKLNCCPVSPGDMSYITERTYTCNRITELEKDMLNLLEGKIYSETFIDFLDCYTDELKDVKDDKDDKDIYYVKVLLLYLCAYFESFQYEGEEVCKEAINVFLFRKYGDQKYVNKESQLQNFIFSSITVGTKKDIIEPLYEFFDRKKLDRSVLGITLRKEI